MLIREEKRNHVQRVTYKLIRLSERRVLNVQAVSCYPTEGGIIEHNDTVGVVGKAFQC
jgi:hypothetical protein